MNRKNTFEPQRHHNQQRAKATLLTVGFSPLTIGVLVVELIKKAKKQSIT